MIRKPNWIKSPIPIGNNFTNLKKLVLKNKLHTVCQEAKCPNLGECWNLGTLTFMILGDTCTRSCGFCAVKTGRGGTIDYLEPKRLSRGILNLKRIGAAISKLFLYPSSKVIIIPSFGRFKIRSVHLYKLIFLFL